MCDNIPVMMQCAARSALHSLPLTHHNVSLT